jgi:hypothetical protein
LYYAIGRAVAGALVGAALVEGATRQSGMEYVVQTENNNMMSIVQGTAAPFVVGDKSCCTDRRRASSPLSDGPDQAQQTRLRPVRFASYSVASARAPSRRGAWCASNDGPGALNCRHGAASKSP